MKIIFELDEKWKEIKNYPSYKISDHGRIKRIKTSKGARAGKILKSNIGSHGYLSINLCEDGEAKSFLVHKLVTEAFLGQCPEGCQVNHKDGNKLNPCIENLEHVEPKENIKHSMKLGLRDNEGKNNGNSKLKEKDILKIRKLYRTGNYIQEEIARMFNISRSLISHIVNNEIWKHV